jgi:hypothetical protein
MYQSSTVDESNSLLTAFASIGIKYDLSLFQISGYLIVHEEVSTHSSTIL